MGGRKARNMRIAGKIFGKPSEDLEANGLRLQAVKKIGLCYDHRQNIATVGMQVASR
jgi:hypothetical protein